MVRRLRAEQGMSKSELAKKAGVGRNTIGRIESHGRAVDFTYGRIAQALGVPLAQLLGEGDQ
jgi:transcriptional regulator with XRE-family HTH domain